MRRNDRLDENERSGKESKSSGPVGAIARWVDNTRARYRSRHGGVPVVTIVALVAIGVATLGLLVAPTVADTGTFEGEIVLEGDAATSSTSWSYEIEDLDAVDDFSVVLEGDRVTEDVSESGTLETGESYQIEPSGNTAPEDAVVEIEGQRDETEQSESVSDGDSISVDGGNVGPANEEIVISADYVESSISQSGTADTSTSESITIDGALDPSGESIDLSNPRRKEIQTQSYTFDRYMSSGTTLASGTIDVSGTNFIDEMTAPTYESDETAGPIEVYVDGELLGSDSYDNGMHVDDNLIDVSGKSSVSWEVYFPTGVGGSLSMDDEPFTFRTKSPSEVTVDGSTVSTTGSKTLDFAPETTETVDIATDNGTVDYSISGTDRDGVEDVSVSVDGSTVSNNGVLDGSKTESVSLSEGSHTVSISATGDMSMLSTNVDWTQIYQTEDPAIDVGETTIYEPGLLGDGETVTESIDLTETETKEIERTGGEHVAKVSTSWTEVAETQNPSISVNGETSSYSGPLAEGSTTSLDVSEDDIQEGENTVSVDLDGSNGGPEPQVGVTYSHTAATVAAEETVNSTTWSEDVEVARTFASDQSDVSLRIGMPDNVLEVGEIEERRSGGEWSSVSPDRYELDGTDLEVSMGDVEAEETVEVRAVGDKTRVLEGEIEVVDPTLEGADLSTRMRVSDKPADEPVAIEVSETAVADRVHLVESAEWTPSEYHTSKADGTEILYLPDAVEDAEATIETVPLSISPETGEAETSIDNRSEIRFSIEPGSTSGDELEVGYYDTESGEYYELYSVTEDRQIDMQQASSPVFFSTDDRESTYLIQITDPPGSSTIVGADTEGGGLPPMLLLLAGIGGVGGVGIVSQRLGLGRRITIPVAAVAAFGIAELSTPTSLLGTISNDLIRSSSTALVASIATLGALGGTWLLDRRTAREIPTWLYGAIGVGGAAWLASSALGDVGGSIAGLLVGGSILVGLWGASRRWELPRWIVAIVGGGATLLMLESVVPGLLEELVVGPLSEGAREIAPLVVLGVLVVVVLWLRRRGDEDEVTLQVVDDD